MSSPSPSNNPWDVRTIASLLIAHLGERAVCHANYRALWAHRHGDQRKMEAWQWVARTTQEILRSEPATAEEHTA